VSPGSEEGPLGEVGSCEHSNKCSSSIKLEEFHEQLNDYQFLNNVSKP